MLLKRCCRKAISTVDIVWTLRGYPRFNSTTHEQIPVQTNPSIDFAPGRKIAWLTHRSLIEVKGKDNTALLQYVCTNNVKSMNDDLPLIYSVVLGAKKYGNVSHDILIYRGTEGQYFIECDRFHVEVTEYYARKKNFQTGKGSLVKLLEQYIIQQELDVKVSKSVKQICCVFHPGLTIRDHGFRDHATLVKKLYPVLTNEEQIYPDPRCSHQLGARILTEDADALLQRINPTHYSVVPVAHYKRHRYMLGVNEGFKEMGFGMGSTGQFNVDFLGGLDNKKNVPYIGHEFVQHGESPRKRVLPVWLENRPGLDISQLGKGKGKGKDIFFGDRKIGHLVELNSTHPRKEMISVTKKKRSVMEEQDVFVGIGVIDFRKHILRNALSFDTTELYTLGSGETGTEKIRIVSFNPDWWPLWYLSATRRV